MQSLFQKQKGFTIVELLIVVVVIAILAAITIVAYNGISNRAKESAVASMASQVQKKLALYAVQNNEQYPDTLTDAGIDAVTAAKVQYSPNNTSSPRGFCVTASDSGVSLYAAKSFSYTTTSAQTVDQTNPIAGACPGHALNNGATVTNLIPNPALRPTSVTGWGAVASTGGAQTGGRVTSVSGLSSLGITTAYRNTLGGTPGSWWRVQNAPGITVTPGVSYVLSGYIRPSVNTSTGVIIIWNTSSGSIENASAFSSHAAGAWIRKSVIATAPPDVTSVRLQFGATGNGVSGAYLDASAAMFHAGSTVYDYADGNSTGWVWNGSPDSSESKGPATSS